MQITDKDIQTFRERAKTELQSNGAVGRLAWDAVVNALCDEVEELRKNAAPGNAAALREALKRAVDELDCIQQSVNPDGITISASRALRDCREALAAPARNCDRYATANDAEAGYIAEHPHDDEPDASTYGSWLFAPAAEQKGENK